MCGRLSGHLRDTKIPQEGQRIRSEWQLGCEGKSMKPKEFGGEGGIRTLGTGISPYNGLANRRIRPLCHLSGAAK